MTLAKGNMTQLPCLSTLIVTPCSGGFTGFQEAEFWLHFIPLKRSPSHDHAQKWQDENLDIIHQIRSCLHRFRVELRGYFLCWKWVQSIKDSSLWSVKMCGTEQVNPVPGFSWWTCEINIGEADGDSTVLNRERKLVILICLRKVQVFIMSWSMYKELVKTSSPHNKNRNEVFPTKMPLECWAVHRTWRDEKETSLVTVIRLTWRAARLRSYAGMLSASF